MLPLLVAPRNAYPDKAALAKNSDHLVWSEPRCPAFTQPWPRRASHLQV